MLALLAAALLAANDTALVCVAPQPVNGATVQPNIVIASFVDAGTVWAQTSHQTTSVTDGTASSTTDQTQQLLASFVDAGVVIAGGLTGSRLDSSKVCVGGWSADGSCTGAQLALVGGIAYFQNVANGGYLQCQSAGEGACETNVNFQPVADNSQSLGLGASRWSTVYGVTGKLDTVDAGSAMFSGQVQQLGRTMATAMPFDGGSPGAIYTEYGMGTALSSGAVTITFIHAFSQIPVCWCLHVDTTNTNPCTLNHSVAHSTTQVGFAVASGGSDKIDWACTGER